MEKCKLKSPLIAINLINYFASGQKKWCLIKKDYICVNNGNNEYNYNNCWNFDAVYYTCKMQKCKLKCPLLTINLINHFSPLSKKMMFDEKDYICVNIENNEYINCWNFDT